MLQIRIMSTQPIDGHPSPRLCAWGLSTSLQIHTDKVAPVLSAK